MAKNKKVDIWAEDNLAEKPNRASKPVELSERWQRVARTYIKVAAWSFPIFLVLIFAVYGSMNETVAPVQAKTVNQVDSAGKATAIQTVNTWMDAKPSPVDGGKILSWDGFDVQPKPKLTEDEAKAIPQPDYDVEIHHFTVVDRRGIQYLSDVAVAVSEANGSSALGTPSLNPVATSATGWSGSGTWYGLAPISAPESIRPAVKAWAKAFTSGDPDQLRLIVSDPDGDRSYMPLSGVKAVTVELGDNAGYVPEFIDGRLSEATPKSVVVQVKLKITWEPESGAEEPQYVGQSGDASITYDLLINKADTAAPVVVAWGGPGSGQHLKTFGNAILDRELVAASDKEEK
ncbi:hypothetical protein [Leifsonia sp. Leaf264]|uniref:hypothetical protein n=1 Tax=Leifsonia sp. Leaf264 TaxID=1736314 RepID=UPI00070109D9|nr:hypothetical protein [Leifsonia sp. Leaf264]KQO98744.1 hypothetical protein ASF30_11830 [Leifsonia sp. Leaf264]